MRPLDGHLPLTGGRPEPQRAEASRPPGLSTWVTEPGLDVDS